MVRVCHGTCELGEAGSKLRPYRRPFVTHAHCRLCDVWIEKGKGWGKGGVRCPCCHGIMASSPRLQKRKRAYREVMDTINYIKLKVPVNKMPFDEDVIGDFKR